jgi:hypothetical protein
MPRLGRFSSYAASATSQIFPVSSPSTRLIIDRAARSCHSVSRAGSTPNRLSSCCQPSMSSDTPALRQKWRPIFVDTSKMTNLNTQVVKRVSPRNSPTLAMIASSASAAACCATSSSSGPVIRTRRERRSTLRRAIRSSIRFSRFTARSCSGPAELRDWTHAAGSDSHVGDVLPPADPTSPRLATGPRLPEPVTLATPIRAGSWSAGKNRNARGHE